MARYLKVSSIGTPAPPLPRDSSIDLSEHMLAFWREKLAQVLPDSPDLIVLPEFSDIYVEHEGPQALAYLKENGRKQLDFFQSVARDNNVNLLYPTMRLTEDGSARNTARLIDRNGKVIGGYNKNHVTIGETEVFGILNGSEAPIIECDFGRVACVTCFDLNFDELRAKYAAARPELILFVSLYHGGLMQPYWAYSCRSWFVSAIGLNGLHSSVISPLGQHIASNTFHHDFVTATINLDYCIAHLDGNLQKLKDLKKRYGADVTITDPGLTGTIMISSESKERTAPEMVREFEIELFDDYLQRVRAFQCRPENREPDGVFVN